jgi:hypothetical protein
VLVLVKGQISDFDERNALMIGDVFKLSSESLASIVVKRHADIQCRTEEAADSR